VCGNCALVQLLYKIFAKHSWIACARLHRKAFLDCIAKYSKIAARMAAVCMWLLYPALVGVAFVR